MIPFSDFLIELEMKKKIRILVKEKRGWPSNFTSAAQAREKHRRLRMRR